MEGKFNLNVIVVILILIVIPYCLIQSCILYQSYHLCFSVIDIDWGSTKFLATACGRKLQQVLSLRIVRHLTLEGKLSRLFDIENLLFKEKLLNNHHISQGNKKFMRIIVFVMTFMETMLVLDVTQLGKIRFVKMVWENLIDTLSLLTLSIKYTCQVGRYFFLDKVKMFDTVYRMIRSNN